MNHPYGPYGQQYPGQPQHPAYPPQRGFPPPGYPPQQGHPAHPGFPPAPMRPTGPSGTTATAAAVLAALGTFAMLGFGLLLLAAVGSPDPEPAWGTTTSRSSGAGDAIMAIAGVAVIVAGLVLAAGAATLLQRKMVGRWLVVAGSAVALLVSVLVLAGSAVLLANITGSDASGYAYIFGYYAPILLGGAAFPIVTLALALRPSTAAWIRAKPNPHPVPPPYYSPYRG